MIVKKNNREYQINRINKKNPNLTHNSAGNKIVGFFYNAIAETVDVIALQYENINDVFVIGKDYDIESGLWSGGRYDYRSYDDARNNVWGRELSIEEVVKLYNSGEIISWKKHHDYD